MYTNIPKIDIRDIIANILKINSGINETIHILKTVKERNHFQFEQKYYEQTNGQSMRAPTSAILAEAYIQNMEHKQMYSISTKHQII
jgi:hypothetical protein